MWLSKHDNNPTVVEVVFALKKWEVVASDGKETLRIVANIELYWRDERMVGFPTARKPMPENIWRPRMTGCAGFDLGKAENYELIPRFYSHDQDSPDRPSDGTLAMTFPVSLRDGFDISATWNASGRSRSIRRRPLHRLLRRQETGVRQGSSAFSAST